MVLQISGCEIFVWRQQNPVVCISSSELKLQNVSQVPANMLNHGSPSKPSLNSEKLLLRSIRPICQYIRDVEN